MLPFSLEAQDKIDFGFSSEAVSTTKGIFACQSVDMYKGLVCLRAGLLYGSSYVDEQTTIGMKVDFVLMPLKRDDGTFNFQFISSFIQFKNTISVGNATTCTNNLQFTMGYGFQYAILKNVFLSSSLEFGSILEKRNFNFKTNAPSIKIGYAGTALLGIGYRL